MLGEVLVWLLECTGQIINVMKKFELGGGLNFFSLFFCLTAVGILYELLRHIRGERQADERWLRNMQRYDEYRKKQKYEKEEKERRIKLRGNILH